MKKKVLLACMTALLIGLTGCGNKAEVSSQDVIQESQTDVEAATGSSEAVVENLEERTSLVVGFDAEFPPYGYMDENGEYVGFDLDLAAEVCERNGWELVKQPIDWAAKDLELSSGTIDCIWNGFTINGREDDYTWSIPYVNNKQVVVVTESSGITDLAGLADKVMGVQQDSSALSALEEEANADLAASLAG